MTLPGPAHHFLAFWEHTIGPGSPASLADRWRAWEMSGVDRGRALVVSLERHCCLANQTVLDIGCGYGGTTIACCLAGATAVGLDPDPQRLRGARIWAHDDWGLRDATFCSGRAESLPLPDATADVVVCDNVLEHVHSHRQTLAEVGRVLRPGGLAYVSFPNYLSVRNLRSDPHFSLAGVSLLPPRLGRWYVTKVRARSEGFGVGWLPIAAVLSRFLQRHGLQVIEQEPALRRSLGCLAPLARAIHANTVPVLIWVLARSATATRG